MGAHPDARRDPRRRQGRQKPEKRQRRADFAAVLLAPDVLSDKGQIHRGRRADAAHFFQAAQRCAQDVHGAVFLRTGITDLPSRAACGQVPQPDAQRALPAFGGQAQRTAGQALL